MNKTAPSVLVVDDEEDTCLNLSDIFTDLGYRVDTACDGHAALEKVRSTRYDVALLDLMMPGMDGLSLYTEIKKLRPETICVLATAFPTHPRAEESLLVGMWRIIPKPIDISRVLALIGAALDQPMVLIVDDDSELCANLWDLLRAKDFRVSLAHDVKAAAVAMHGGAYQIVLVDMRLPDADGATVFQLVRQLQPSARTLLITGYRAELSSAIKDLTQAGADAVCYKPFDIAELFATLERLSRR